MIQHYFNTDHARFFGLHEAILINHFIYWIEKNQSEGRNFHDGKTWTYMPIKGFEDVYKYFTKKQIRTALKNLIDLQIIITANYNSNPHDRTFWYAFLDECTFLGGKMDLPLRANGDAEEGKCITNNNTSNNSINDISSPSQVQEVTAVQKILDLKVTEHSSVEDKIIKAYYNFFCKHRTKPGIPFSHKTLLNAKLKDWSKDLRLLMKNDKRSIDDLRSMLEFLKTSKDPFWRDTVYSLGGVRKNYDTIWDKMQAESVKANEKKPEVKEGVFQGNIKRVTK